jgi:hypothetical protein
MIAMVYQKSEFRQERRDSFVITFDLDSLFQFDKRKLRIV